MLSDPCPDQISRVGGGNGRLHLHAVEGPKRSWYVAGKFAVEWVLAFMLVVLTLPLLAVLALVVKLTSPGPALYWQTRLGRYGCVYRMCKLRSMVHDCEMKTGPVWSLPGDRRVTPFGRFLRDTHLDELPQLWNVLQGHMGLVGPRPERPEITARIERSLPNFRDRLLVRPGVTGLAQMRLPADRDLEGVRKKLAHDLYYVREVSFLLDVRIAFSTGFYFLAAASQAVCAALVKPYGRAVERNLEPAREPADAYEVGAA